MTTNAPRTSAAGRRAVVVGAGVFGAASALELARRGWAATLLDPGPLPNPRASSTDVSKVVRMDYGADVFYTELMEIAFERWERWNAEWPEPLFHPDGFAILTAEPMAPGGFEHDSFATLTARGHTLERLDRERLARRFPAWNAGRYGDGYFNPRAGWAESGRVVARLIELAREAGVAVVEGAEFLRLVERGSRVAGVETRDGVRHEADVVVVAAGAWTPILLPHLAGFLRPVAQPVVHFRADRPEDFRPPRFSCWAADIARTGWYGFPALADGSVKIGRHGPGNPLDPVELQAAGRGDSPLWRIPADHEEAARAFLRETFPALAGAPLVHSRVCLYCDTPDGDFLVARDPDRPGLAIACGGSGHAFKFAPVLGEIVADAVEDRPNRYGARFGIRPSGAGGREAARSASL